MTGAGRRRPTPVSHTDAGASGTGECLSCSEYAITVEIYMPIAMTIFQ
jgi:hypothetical protein